MAYATPNALPGTVAGQSVTFGTTVFTTMDGVQYKPGGGIIDGSKSGDAGNTGYTDVLRGGTLMGKITASGKYAPAIIDKLAAAYTAGTTDSPSVTVTLTAAGVTEILRRVGTTGNLTIVGPPTAGGSVASTSVTYSSGNATAGTLTLSADMGVDKIIGSLVCPADGSQTILSLVMAEDGIKVSDKDGTRIDVAYPEIPVSGQLNVNGLQFYPTNAVLQAYIKTTMRASCPSWIFSDDI